MSLLAGILTNTPELRTSRYAAIIGAAPSGGARSPHLWNAVFAADGIDCEMLPFDVPEERVADLIAALKTDKRFIGGAVTTPHKMLVMPHLDEIEPEAKHIGATNCIYRQDDKLVGANTDGAGAIPALKELAGGSLAGRGALVIGIGGAGRAVAVYLANEVERLVLANRNKAVAAELADALRAQVKTEAITWPPSAADLRNIDLLVNCSSVGFEALKPVANGMVTFKDATPLAPFKPSAVAAGDSFNAAFAAANKAEIEQNATRSKGLIAALPASAIVFDAIYQPLKTRLLALAEARGLKILNGAAMNIEQAVIAYAKAVPTAGEARHIRTLMQERARQL